jgi:hypothetical protein
MFGKTPRKTVELVRHTELALSCERGPITFEYDPGAPVAEYVKWVSAELEEARKFSADWRRAEQRAETLAHDAQSFLNRACKAEARAEALEKRLSEPLPVVERTIWRVRAKAVELVVLAGVPPGADPAVRAVEFWRAARKLGVPVDQVKGVHQDKDYVEFLNFDDLAPRPAAVYNTTVVEIG